MIRVMIALAEGERKTKKAKLRNAAPSTGLMGAAIVAISSGITLMQAAETQFLGICLVIVGIVLVLLHYYTGE